MFRSLDRRAFVSVALSAAFGPFAALAQGEGAPEAGLPAPAGPRPELPRDDAALTREIGTMLMMGFWGADPRSSDVAAIARWLKDGKIGGVIFFEDNFRSPDDARDLIRMFADAAGASRPFFAVDQEGGAVVRMKPARGFVSLPSAYALANLSPAEAEAFYARSATEMSRIGINLNFGPVVDLALNPRNPIIDRLGRSYGADPTRVAAYAAAFIKAHRDNHVLTALKHFPGHGSSTVDSHKGLPDISKVWEPVELQPYETLLARGPTDMVMVGHLVHRDLTGGVPASLSRKAIQTTLREKLGYEGVVVSDDMQMGALRKTYSADECIRRGMTAGLDLFIYSNREHADPQMPDRFHRVVRTMIESGTMQRTRIRASVRRLEEVKQGFPARSLRVVR